MCVFVSHSPHSSWRWLREVLPRWIPISFYKEFQSLVVFWAILSSPQLPFLSDSPGSPATPHRGLIFSAFVLTQFDIGRKVSGILKLKYSAGIFFWFISLFRFNAAVHVGVRRLSNTFRFSLIWTINLGRLKVGFCADFKYVQIFMCFELMSK